MLLLLKIFYGLAILLHPDHWIYHHHLDRAPWTTFLEINQSLLPGDSVKKTPTLPQASPAGYCVCYSTSSVVSAIQCSPYCKKDLAALASVFSFPIYTVSLFAFYHVCERVLGLFCSGRDDGPKCVLVKRQKGVSLLRSWTTPVHLSVLTTGLGVVASQNLTCVSCPHVANNRAHNRG